MLTIMGFSAQLHTLEAHKIFRLRTKHYLKNLATHELLEVASDYCAHIRRPPPPR
jgi:hypothetical protein